MVIPARSALGQAKGAAMDESTGTNADRDTGHAILDLCALPLDQVLEADDSVLDNALRRVKEQLSRPGENYAAHGTTP
jgi:FXSXX-COOH protein